jgi:chaperonin GroES
MIKLRGLAGNNVAITPNFDPDISTGGLYIPDSAKERCDQGIVKYIGPKVKWLQIGDYVLFSGYSGTYLSVEGEGKLIVMPETYIICIIEPDTTMEVPGLYFKSKDGVYFPATYEMAIEIMTDAFHESDWFQASKRIGYGMKRGTISDKRDYGKSEVFMYVGHHESQIDPALDPSDPEDNPTLVADREKQP